MATAQCGPRRRTAGRDDERVFMTLQNTSPARNAG
jgi:hypothetical protein